MFRLLFDWLSWPDNVIAESLAWLITACVAGAWLASRIARRSRGSVGRPLFFAGLVCVVDVALWAISYRCYDAGVWSATSGDSTWAQWCLDGPPVNAVRDFVLGVMWYILGVVGVHPPHDYFNGSSVGHMHAVIAVLEFPNEAAFLAVLVLGMWCLLGSFTRKRDAAQPPSNPA